MTFRSRPLLDLAKGQECMARILGVCNCNPETTVSAHRNGGGGTKHADWKIAWCCSDCHALIDGQILANEFSAEVRDGFWQLAHERTLEAMFEQGLVQVAGTVPRSPKPYKPSSKIVPRAA